MKLEKTLLNLSRGWLPDSRFRATASPCLPACSFLRLLGLACGLNCGALTHRGYRPGLRLLCRKQNCLVLGLIIHLVYSVTLVIWDREEARAWDTILRPFSIFGFRTHADTDNSIYLLHVDVQTVHILMQDRPHLGAGEALGGDGCVTSSLPRQGLVCKVTSSESSGGVGLWALFWLGLLDFFFGYCAIVNRNESTGRIFNDFLIY